MKLIKVLSAFLLILLINCGKTIRAQTTLPLSQTNTVAIVAKAQSNRVLLRWTPASEQVWKQANQYWQNPNPYGYFVERRVVTRNGQPVSGTTFSRLNQMPLLPVGATQWQSAWQTTPADSSNLKTLKAAIYDDKSVSAPNDTALHVVDRQSDDFDRYIVAMLAADQSYAGAVLAALAYVDESVVANEQYEYRVVVNTPAGQPTIGSTTFQIELADYRPLASPVKPAVRFAQRNATLNWAADTTIQGYNTYWIERSTDGQNFMMRNRTPLLQTSQVDASITYQDTFPLGRRTYYYRLKGQTIFGEIGISAVVVGQSKDTITNVPRIKDARLMSNGSVRLSWQFPGDTIMPRADTLLSGYYIGVASKANDPAVPAKINIAATDTVALVSNYAGKVSSPATLYFTVGAIKKDGDTLRSSPVFVEPFDTIAPQAPRGLQGFITPGGMAQLSWQPNAEPDLLGYKVFRCQRKGEEAVNITYDSILVSSVWRDTVNLNLLNPGVYYHVKAIDRRYNESPLSAPLYLNRPDTIRPVPPLFRGFTLSTNGVRLRWANSFSRDVVRHTLYRREVTNGGWQMLTVFALRDTIQNGQSIALSDTAWIDQSAQASRSYTYLLLAQDAGGLVSDSTAQLVVDVPASLGNQQPYFGVLNAQANADRQAVSLSWSYDAPGIAEYQIYRSVGTMPLGLWRMISGLETTTDDENVKADSVYRYSIRASFRDGTVSNWQSTSVVYRNTISAGQLPYVALPIPAQTGTVGKVLTFTIPAGTFAGDQTPLTSRILPNGLPPGITATGNTLTGTPLRAGTSTITVQATDPKGLAIATTFTLSINNAPVLLTVLKSQTVTVGQSFSYTVPTQAFLDEGGQIAQVGIVAASLPPGLLAIGSTLSGTLSSPGPYTIGVLATDAEGAGTQTSFVLTGNRPPQVVTAPTAQTTAVGKLTNWTLPANTFSDPEGQPLTTRLLSDGLPTGLSVQANGYVGTPTTAGSYTLTVRSSDPLGAATDIRFTLTVVQSANITPIVAALVPSQTLAVGQAVTFMVPDNIFFDEDGRITSVTISGSLPPGLTKQGVRLMGTPTTTGQYALTIMGVDDRGASVQTPLQLTIVDDPGYTQPTASINGILSICSGQATLLTASGGGTYRWNTGETTASISVSVAGPYSVTVSSGSTSSVVTANVSAASAPAVTISGNLTISNGQATTLTADGGTTYRWSNGETTKSISVSVAGTYSVTVSSGGECSGTGSVTVATPSTDNCVVGDPYLINRSFTSSTPVTITAQTQIATSGTVRVETGATLLLKAPQRIRLLPGFNSKTGSTFRARIGPCQ